MTRRRPRIAVTVTRRGPSARLVVDLDGSGWRFRNDAFLQLVGLLRARLGRGRWQACGGRHTWWLKRVPAPLAEALAAELRRLALGYSQPTDDGAGPGAGRAGDTRARRNRQPGPACGCRMWMNLNMTDIYSDRRQPALGTRAREALAKRKLGQVPVCSPEGPAR